MKAFRRICIGLVLLGLALLHWKRDSTFASLPFPGAGLAVKMQANVTEEGNYRIDVSMPKADRALGLSSEMVPCSLAASVAGQSKNVTSLAQYGEYGFAKIQYYRSNEIWHLRPGQYMVEISSLQDCVVAMSRGATISLEQELTNLTGRHLLNELRAKCGAIFLSVGLVGIIACEFKKV